MPKEALNPETVHRPVGGYSHVVIAPAGRLAFIAGQVGVDRHGNIVGKGDMAAQARQALENLKAAADAAGGGQGAAGLGPAPPRAGPAQADVRDGLMPLGAFR